MTTTLRRAALLLFLPLLLLAGLAVSTATTRADAASATTGDLTVCAYGVFTHSVPIQLHLYTDTGWTVIRNGTTGTGCGTWRDVPANRWLAVTVKPTTYGSRVTCYNWPGSWYVLGGGSSSSFYVSPWQAGRVNITVRKTHVYC